jgi:UDP-GlcNAc:undecaprenyl-phosphate/decaprenyl-phosphate GlcNAc-1-phosphate transferase
MLLLLLGTMAVGLGLSLVLTPIARRIASRCGLVDHPDGRRKLHAGPVPLAGGLPLLAATVGAVALLSVVDPGTIGAVFAAESTRLLGLLLAALVICFVGLVDDLGRLRGRHKLLGQTLAVGIVIASGIEVHQIQMFGATIDLGLLSVPFTLFLLLGAINSLNLIDGMDGLLSSVGLIICTGMGAMAALNERWATACIALALAGSLLGFLRYNFPPASVFLGDSGSMLVGLVIGVLAIQSSLKASAAVALAAPTALLTVPIFDTFAAILRRTLTGRSIYTTDRGHLHHCLLRSGLSNRRALALVSAFCMITVFGTLASLALKNELLAILSGVVVIALLVVTRLFGHAELSLLRQRTHSLFSSFFNVPEGKPAREIEVRLHGKVDWKELWQQITACATQLNLGSARLDINAPVINEGYHAEWTDTAVPGEDQEDAASLWRAEIPLITRGRIVGRVAVAGHRDEQPVWEKIATLAHLVQDFESTVLQLTESVWVLSAPEPLRAPHALQPSRAAAS